MSRSNLIVLFLTSLVSMSAHALSTFDTRTVGGSFSVSPGSTQTLTLPGGFARHVKNIVVQANGTRCDSTIDVMVNGQAKGTIYAPGQDPSYIVTIAETTNTISFQHRSGCSMWIGNITATMSSWTGRGSYGGGFAGNSDNVASVAQQIIVTVDSMIAYSTPDNAAEYLLPIKKSAANVYVMATSHGEISRKTSASLEALVLQIDFAQEYVDSLLSTSALFDLGVELKSEREQIVEMLD